MGLPNCSRSLAYATARSRVSRRGPPAGRGEDGAVPKSSCRVVERPTAGSSTAARAASGVEGRRDPLRGGCFADGRHQAPPSAGAAAGRRKAACRRTGVPQPRGPPSELATTPTMAASAAPGTMVAARKVPTSDRDERRPTPRRRRPRRPGQPCRRARAASTRRHRCHPGGQSRRRRRVPRSRGRGCVRGQPPANMGVSLGQLALGLAHPEVHQRDLGSRDALAQCCAALDVPARCQVITCTSCAPARRCRSDRWARQGSAVSAAVSSISMARSPSAWRAPRTRA